MSVSSFFQSMPAFTEDACEMSLFQAKWPNGFRCPHCDSRAFYRLTSRSRRLYECRSCSHQTSLTVGTIMEGTRTPLVKWFQALFLMQSGISSKLLSELLQVTYKTAWLMNHKLRFAIQVHDESRPLTGNIQLYGNFYARPAVSRLSDPLEPRDQPAVVGASVDPETGDIADVKIKRMSAADFNRRLFGIESFGSFLWRYVSEDRGVDRRIEVVNVSDQHGVTALGAIWRGVIDWLARTFGGIGPKHLQAYLDEYCFRVNIRANVFGTLLSLCGSTATITHRELVRKTRSVRAIRWTGFNKKKLSDRTSAVS